LPRIYELDPHVADLIAAGEVVERPASVVKELMENSIDAGAGIITAEIAAGGMTLIRVTDNGCGIAPGDVKTAFLRHATSKLRGAEGLEAIGTLGFRGEALAAVAAVSRIELLTREPGAGEGTGLLLEAGEVVDIYPAGCPEGTTIIVRDLFFNTPARLKFMKSDRAESSAVASAALRCALSHPEVSVRLIRDGKTEFHTPGDSRVDSCIYSLFGREFSVGLLGAESSDEFVTVSGFISAPAAARGNRSYQFFFVNGRPIRSLTLQAALEQAYANTLSSGRFPSCVLYITTRPGDVDVNVHPAKTEIKFVSDKQVFDGVYYAALSALEREASGREVSGKWKVESGKFEDGDASRREARGKWKVESGKIEDGDESRREARGKWKVESGKIEDGDASGRVVRGLAPAGNAGIQRFESASIGGFKSMQVDDYRGKYVTPNTPLPARAAGDVLNSSTDFRLIGEALKTYIIIEHKGAVWFIDKHAAHERIHFDALRSEGYSPMSQALITPVVCRHGHEDASLLLENADMLETLGFTVESFGDDAVAVRQIPADIDIRDAEPALSEICAELRQGGVSDPTRRDSIYRKIACKAAIKAGKSSGARELEELAARVMSGEISHCPHGRPVAFEITKAFLDKGFKRI